MQTRAGRNASGLRHGHRATKLAQLMPRGLSFEHRMLYNWILRAIRNCFLPVGDRRLLAGEIGSAGKEDEKR